MKKRKPEVTSKKVASKAAKLMKEIDTRMKNIVALRAELCCHIYTIEEVYETLELAKSVAASALTQREK